MYNYFMLMGRVVKDPEIKEVDGGKRIITINLAVNRCFRNINGEIETDYFSITFWDFLLDYIQDNLKKGFPIVVKGRMEMRNNAVELIGERIIFFHKNEEE